MGAALNAPPEIPLPPHSDEAEQFLLGALMLESSLWDKISGKLSDADFYRDDHKRIFRHIALLAERGVETDILAVYDSIERSKEVQQTGGLAYLSDIANATPGGSGIVRHAEIIRERALRRRAQQVAMGLHDAASNAELASALQIAEMGLAAIHERSAGAWAFKAIDVARALQDDAPPIHWLFDQRLQLGRGAVLSAVGGSSKTRVLYHLGIGSVIGRLTWDWTIGATGKAVLVLTEDTPEDAHRTLHAACGAMAATDRECETIAANLKVFALAGKACRLLDFSGQDLVPSANFHALEREIKRLGNVVFVGLDPALALTPGDELNQGHQRSLGKLVDDLAVRTGACAVLTAHASKGTGALDELQSHTARGGGAITDAVRAEFSLRTMTAKEARTFGIADLEERKRHVQLVATKGNHLPPAAFIPAWLRRGEFGALAAAELSEVQQSTIGKAEMDARAVLRQISETNVKRLEEWRDACVERGIIASTSNDVSKKAMQRIVNRLLDAGLIERGFGRGVYVATQPEGAES